MTKLLCAIDDTEHSHPALDLAGKMAGALNADLTVMTVNQLIGGYGRGGAPTLLLSEKEADRVLEGAAGEAKKAGAANIKLVAIESRDPAQTITRYAEENGFDQIIVGTGGKGAMTRLMLGSVSQDVVQRAHCPVTVAR